MARHAVEERKMAATMLGSSKEAVPEAEDLSSDDRDSLGVDHLHFIDDGSIFDFSKVSNLTSMSAHAEIIFFNSPSGLGSNIRNYDDKVVLQKARFIATKYNF